MAPKGPPAKGAGGPIPGADALGTVEETPLATAGGTRPPAITAGAPPPGTGVPGGKEESSSVTHVELHSLRWHGESKGGKQHQAMGKADLNGLQFRSTIFIINLIISTPIHPLSVFNDSTRVKCAQLPCMQQLHVQHQQHRVRNGRHDRHGPAGRTRYPPQ